MRKPILKLFSAVFISSIISGCATASEKYGFNDVKTMVTSRSGVTPEWDQGTPEDQKVSEAIQSMLKDNLTADQSVQIALLYNPSLQATFEDLGIAQANLVQAGLLENPVFEASVRFPDESEEGTNTEFSVSQNFIDIFMVPLRKRVAEEQFEQIKLEVASAVLNHVTMVKMAYYRLQAGEQMLTMRRDVLKASHAAKEFAQRQREAGNISDLDLSIHQSAYHKAKIEFDRNEQEILSLREGLSLLMGIPHDRSDWKIISNLPYVSTIEPSLAELQAQAEMMLLIKITKSNFNIGFFIVRM